MLSPCFCPRHIFKHPFPQLTECRLWMLPPGCTWISAHQTQRHILPWCRAREKQKGERKHLFQEATYKITMELYAGEKKLPAAPYLLKLYPAEGAQETREQAQVGASRRSFLVSSETAGLHLCYLLGSLTLWGAVSCPLTCAHQQMSFCKTQHGKPHTTVTIQRKLTCQSLTSLKLLFDQGRSRVGKHSFCYSG